jgi:predicted phosphodiesterase
VRVAVISDIHGNRPALEAVLDDIERQHVDFIVNLGDSLSSPVDPRGTADLLLDLKARTVRGNHDRYLIEGGVFELGPTDRFALAQLEPRHLAFLEALPKTLTVEERIFLSHATPGDDSTPWLDEFWKGRTTRQPDEAEVAAAAEGIDVPVLLCGHTHIPRAVRLADGRLIVNPGAVGLQFVHGSPDARYAVLEENDGKWSVTFRALPYDHEAAARLAEQNGFPQWHAALTTGWAGMKGLF